MLSTRWAQSFFFFFNKRFQLNSPPFCLSYYQWCQLTLWHQVDVSCWIDTELNVVFARTHTLETYWSAQGRGMDTLPWRWTTKGQRSAQHQLTLKKSKGLGFSYCRLTPMFRSVWNPETIVSSPKFVILFFNKSESQVAETASPVSN